MSNHTIFVPELSTDMLWNSLEHFTECCNYDVALQK